MTLRIVTRRTNHEKWTWLNDNGILVGQVLTRPANGTTILFINGKYGSISKKITQIFPNAIIGSEISVYYFM